MQPQFQRLLWRQLNCNLCKSTLFRVNLIPRFSYLRTRIVSKVVCRGGSLSVRRPGNDVDFLYEHILSTIVVRNYRDNCEKRRCSFSHKQRKTLKDFQNNVIIYVYKDLRPKTLGLILGLMSHIITRMEN